MMTREDILYLFPQATEEKIAQMIDLYKRKIAEGKAPMQRMIDAANQAAADAQQQSDALRQQMDQLWAEELQRRDAQQRAAELALLEKRFDAAVGEREFVHPLVREGILQAFIAGAEDPQQKKSDFELLESLTEGQNCFVKPVHLQMGSVGEVSGQDLDRLTDAEYYAAFSKADR